MKNLLILEQIGYKMNPHKLHTELKRAAVLHIFPCYYWKKRNLAIKEYLH